MPQRRVGKQGAAIATAKNVLRGALGNKKGDIPRAVSGAIDEVDESEIELLADWVQQHAIGRSRIFPPPNIAKYADLWPTRSFTQIDDLPKALIWFSRLLAPHVEIINRFVELVSRYELAFLSGDLEASVKWLDQIEIDLGLSLWLIQARIALLHRFKGLEAQKEYLRFIHAEVPQTIPSFLAHYTSQRNEDSTSMERFAIRMRAEIERQPIDAAYKTDLVIRLVGRGNTPIEEDDLAAALSAGSVFSIPDAYEALIESLQAILQSSDLYLFAGSVKDALQHLCVVDWRVSKLQAILYGGYNGLQIRDLRADDALLHGQFDEAIEVALLQATANPLDIDAVAVAAAGYAAADLEPGEGRLSGFQHEVLALITTIRAKRGSVTKAVSDLSKLIQNFRSLRIAGAIYGYLAIDWLEKPQVGVCDGTSIAYSTPYVNPRHWIVLSKDAAQHLLAYCERGGNESTVTSTSRVQLQGKEVSLPEFPLEQRFELDTSTALYHNDIVHAREYIQVLSASSRPTCRRLAGKVDIYCLLVDGLEDEAIRRTARYCCEYDEFRFVLPLRSMLKGGKWKELRHLAADIALPVILDLYWRTIDESEHETTRRNAYAEFLRAHECRRPSELARIADRFERSQLVYFLSTVCVPHVMDVSFDVFTTSRQLMEERIKICSLLSELDPAHSSQYNDELKDITANLAIQDGLRDIDRSRVHVNVEAVERWAEKQLEESFKRYKDLLRAGVGFGSPEDFNRTMRKLGEGDATTVRKVIEYPEQEGDSLLIETFETIKSEYLTNSDYGLDAYLSMRIRHGSLAGHLRGPLEEKNLIVSRMETGGKYQDNVAILERLALRDASDNEGVFSAFREFSERYDEIIEDLTKTRLQIRRAERPNGMFALRVETHPLALPFVRSRIQEDTSFSEFVQLLVGVINTLLEPVLSQVRDYIMSVVKQDVEAAFEVLRAVLEKNTSQRAYVRLNSAIADVIPEVQAAIDRVAEWFVPAHEQEQLVVRKFEQIVDIGIEATRSAHRGFVPRIEREIEDIDVKATGLLSDITDILFTILDNVYLHSGNRVSPWVQLKVWSENVGSSHRRVRIRVESEVTDAAYSEESADKLNRIREQIASGEYRRHVNREGGTGLLKLTRLVSVDERNSFDFGFIGTDVFFVEVGVVMAVLTFPADEKAEGE